MDTQFVELQLVTSIFDSKLLSNLAPPFLGAVIALMGQYLFNRSKRKSEANYLAVRVFFVLDKFVKDCALLIDHYNNDYGNFLDQINSETGALNLPHDVNWNSIDKQLLIKILSLKESFYVESTYCEDDPDGKSEACNNLSLMRAQVGKEALSVLIEIAKKKEWGLPSEQDYSHFSKKFEKYCGNS